MLCKRFPQEYKAKTKRNPTLALQNKLENRKYVLRIRIECRKATAKRYLFRLENRATDDNITLM